MSTKESDASRPIAFACHNCKRQKKRCDVARPCPRCAAKGIDCVPYRRPESVPSASLLQAAPTSPIPIPRRTLSPPQASATPPLDYDYPDTPRSYPSSPLQFWHYTNDPLPIGPFSPPAAAQVPVSAPMYSQPDAFVGYPSPTFRYWPAQYGSLPNYDHSIKYQYSPPFIAAPSPEMQYNWTMPDQFGQKPEEPRTMPSLFPSDQQSAFLPGPSNQAYDYGSNRRNGQPESFSAPSSGYQGSTDWLTPPFNPFM